jgi:hypothetical protein
MTLARMAEIDEQSMISYIKSIINSGIENITEQNIQKIKQYYKQLSRAAVNERSLILLEYFIELSDTLKIISKGPDDRTEKEMKRIESFTQKWFDEKLIEKCGMTTSPEKIDELDTFLKYTISIYKLLCTMNLIKIDENWRYIQNIKNPTIEMYEEAINQSNKRLRFINIFSFEMQIQMGRPNSFVWMQPFTQ